MSALIRALATLILAASAGTAQAQTYPNRTITLVVPAAPGGVSDVMGRLIAQRLTEAFGQQVIVENKGGANHVIGAAMVGKAAPDGHALMVAAETVFVINPALHGSKLPYDVNDFAPITGLVRINQGLLAHPSLPANNIAELIALARSPARSPTAPRASARPATSTWRCWRAWPASSSRRCTTAAQRRRSTTCWPGTSC